MAHPMPTPLRLCLPDELCLRPPPRAEGEDSLPLSHMRLNGKPVGQPLQGKVLEAAVAVDAGYLLFLTDGVPMEDMLSIHLIDPSGDLLDSATLGGAYSSGAFADLRLLPPDKVQFRFIGAVPWVVTLLTDKALRLPYGGEQKGVSRPFGFTRRFVVQSLSAPRHGG